MPRVIVEREPILESRLGAAWQNYMALHGTVWHYMALHGTTCYILTSKKGTQSISQGDRV